MSIKEDLNVDNVSADLAVRGGEFQVWQVFGTKEC